MKKQNGSILKSWLIKMEKYLKSQKILVLTLFAFPFFARTLVR